MRPYLYIAKVRMLSALAYRFDVLSSIVIQCLAVIASCFFWIAAYGNQQAALGVTRDQMLTYTDRHVQHIGLPAYHECRKPNCSQRPERIRRTGSSKACEYIWYLSVGGYWQRCHCLSSKRRSAAVDRSFIYCCSCSRVGGSLSAVYSQRGV